MSLKKKNICTLMMILGTYLFPEGSAAQQNQQNPLDTIQHTLDQLQNELDAKYNRYYDSYKVPGVHLNGIMLYEYNGQNELSCERSFSKGSGYGMYIYEKKHKVQSVTSSPYSKRMITDKYDDKDVLLEETEYTSPHSVDKKVYRYESVKHKNDDTAIYKTFANERLEWTGVYIYSKGKKLQEVDMYHYDDTVASKTFYSEYNENGKHVETTKILNPGYDYNVENIYVYSSKKQLEKSIENNLGTNKKEEHFYYYNSDDKEIKREEYKDGTLSFTVTSEYDVQKNLVCEKGVNGSGMLVYQCIYLYDNKNNKTAYLYFYFIAG